MLFKNQIGDLIARFQDTQSDDNEKQPGKVYLKTKITNKRQLDLPGAPRMENQHPIRIEKVISHQSSFGSR